MAGVEGRVALVTGGGRGIGRATAELLASRDARVMCVARSKQELAEVGLDYVVADLATPEGCAHAIAETERRLGPVDILVCNHGLGSAHEGSGHWWGQRLTSVALVPLTLLFVFPLAYNLGASHTRVLEAYSHPVNAIVAILFFITVFRHLQQGLQVVIEDYVPGKVARTVLLLANFLFCWLFGLTGVFAVVRIAIGA